jgi:hypothetical protein
VREVRRDQRAGRREAASKAGPDRRYQDQRHQLGSDGEPEQYAAQCTAPHRDHCGHHQEGDEQFDVAVVAGF